MSLNQEDKEILHEFISESNEAIEKTELILLKLEDNFTASEQPEAGLIDTIFRTFHSIKGSAGFIGLEITSALTHQAETLLDQIRKGKTNISKKHIDIFLEVCDSLQLLMDHIGEIYSEDGFSGDLSSLENRMSDMAGTAKPSPVEKTAQPAEEKNADFLSDENFITPEMEVQFVTDSMELLDKLEQDLLALEQNPRNSELIESAFRSLHSLKGNAGFFNYEDIAVISHKAESFLDNVRSGEVQASTKQISIILKVLDFISIALESLKDGRKPVIPGKHGLIALMGDVFASAVQEEPDTEVQEAEAAPEPAPPQKTEDVPQEEAPKAADKKEESETAKSTENPKKKVSELIRVDVEKLNKLMELIGEIVISESMISHNPELQLIENEIVEKSISYLKKNVRELQELATSMRMIPLSGLFGKMRRLVRDISAKKKNQVEFVTDGGDTEVDRSVIEHISDPLVHILRNSIDHGIEAPDTRIEKGKEAHGTIFLNAHRVGGEIWISIKDDGAGLDRGKILEKAKSKGLVNEREDDLNDKQIYNLIFKPGFSTADKVTDISGRGVGMDVVLRNIEKLRGRIDVSSEQGKGTTIQLKIPITTAIVDGMLVRVDNTIYAIPTLDIKESIQIRESQVVELVDGQEIVKVRDKLIPVLHFQEIHQLGYSKKALNKGIVVVTESAGKETGFLVDEIIGHQQLVIKPLPSYIGSLGGVSGCAILGDGNISLIVDLASMVTIAESMVSD